MVASEEETASYEPSTDDDLVPYVDKDMSMPNTSNSRRHECEICKSTYANQDGKALYCCFVTNRRGLRRHLRKNHLMERQDPKKMGFHGVKGSAIRRANVIKRIEGGIKGKDFRIQGKSYGINGKLHGQRGKDQVSKYRSLLQTTLWPFLLKINHSKEEETLATEESTRQEEESQKVKKSLRDSKGRFIRSTSDVLKV